ncbi:NPTX2 [Branchiostoma lanceolatum]|uniref:NPTX2 protein n=1 Tax=Branchiostoma lanceolatum TaxID=7740 RepID=A0A8K0A1P1_BRALA|nr:NPTX2 [Branchiostoma lanceolatum]
MMLSLRLKYGFLVVMTLSMCWQDGAKALTKERLNHIARRIIQIHEKVNRTSLSVVNTSLSLQYMANTGFPQIPTVTHVQNIITTQQPPLRALKFPSPRSVQNYVQLRPGMVSGLTALTVCLNIRTDSMSSGTLFSYATAQSWHGNGVLLYGSNNQMSFMVTIHGQDSPWLDLRVLDGEWHIVCLTWENSGLMRIFTDGQRMAEHYGLAAGHVVNPGGVCIVGQDQDWLGGGFDLGEGYEGDISNLNMWNYVLSEDEMADAKSCRLYGNVIDWRDVEMSLRGAVTESNIECADRYMVDDGCPVGYRPLVGTCIRLIFDGTSHDIAHQACLSDGAILAMPKTQEFDLALRDLVKNDGGNNQYWIGLWEGTGNTDWQWMDGSPLQTYDYQGWNPGEPSNVFSFLFDMCVNYWSGPTGYPMWDDSDCWYSHGYICQTDPV